MIFCEAIISPKGIMEVLVQGDQRKAIETALVRRGLKPQMIEVVANDLLRGDHFFFLVLSTTSIICGFNPRRTRAVSMSYNR
jgi:hypothetical protein